MLARALNCDSERFFDAIFIQLFFWIMPEPFPETLIGANPNYYLRRFLGVRHAGLAPFPAEAIAEYLRCFADPAAIHVSCEDYRAAESIDLEHD